MPPRTPMSCGKPPTPEMKTYHFEFGVVVHDDNMTDAIAQAQTLISENPIDPTKVWVYDEDGDVLLDSIDFAFGGENG